MIHAILYLVLNLTEVLHLVHPRFNAHPLAAAVRRMIGQRSGRLGATAVPVERNRSAGTPQRSSTKEPPPQKAALLLHPVNCKQLSHLGFLAKHFLSNLRSLAKHFLSNLRPAPWTNGYVLSVPPYQGGIQGG